MMVNKFLKEHWLYLTKPGEYPGIDLLRAIAISLVLLFHFNIPLFRMGHFGVDVFFVISGFLIGGKIYDRINSNSFKVVEFYGNRFLRIVPLYWFFIVITSINGLAHNTYDSNGSLIKSLLLTVFFLQTAVPYYFDAPIQHFVVPDGSWTLCIEEFFYILFPITMVALSKYLKAKGVVVALFILFFMGPLIRLYATKNFMPDDNNWHLASYIQFHSRYDELVVGVIAAIAVRKKISSVWITMVGFILLGFALTYMSSHEIFYNAPEKLTGATIWMPTVISLGIAGLALSYANYKFENTVITFIARLSYPLYLGHIFAQHYLGRFDLWNKVLPEYFHALHPVSYLMILLSVLFAYVLSLTIEYPFLRMYHNEK